MTGAPDDLKSLMLLGGTNESAQLGDQTPLAFAVDSLSRRSDRDAILRLVVYAREHSDVRPLNSALLGGLNAKEVYENGEGILHTAAVVGTPDALESLILLGGVDPNLRSKGGQTPLKIAIAMTVMLTDAGSDEAPRLAANVAALQRLGAKA